MSPTKEPKTPLDRYPASPMKQQHEEIIKIMEENGATEEEIESVTYDPDKVLPDSNDANNVWTAKKQ